MTRLDPPADAVQEALGLGRRRTALVTLLLVTLAAATALLPVADTDLSVDLGPAARWLSHAVAGLSWPVLTTLVAVSGVHYAAAAIASRAAAGVPLPPGELFAAQFAASAANRITPAGLGGAGVIGRFLSKRGRLTVPQAAAAVSTLAVLGGIADTAAFAALIGVCALLGVGNAGHEVPLLVSRLSGLVPLSGRAWMWVPIAVAAAVVTAVFVRSHRRGGNATLRRMAAAARDFRTAAVSLARHPRRLAALMTASASTTLLLATGFAAVAVYGPTGLPAGSFAAVMIGYMVASAASNAVPTPGGVGAAEAALVGVLLAGNAVAGPALVTVLAFRLITFWAPAIVGLAVARPLCRRGAL